MVEDTEDHKMEAMAKVDISNQRGMEIMVNRAMVMGNRLVVVNLAFKLAVQHAQLRHVVVVFVIF